MAVEVLPTTPTSNNFIGTDADEFANSTPATETFTMGGGTNTIYFDLSGNKLLGADEIYLTSGENLVLNFTSDAQFNYFDTSLIDWERVQNNDGTIDIAIKTKPFMTLGYMKTKVVTGEIDYSYSYSTYYKAVITEYLYDYEQDKWVEINSWNSSARYESTTYGLQYLNSKGQIQGWYKNETHSSDRHEEMADRIGEVTTKIDYDAEPINTILIKNIGAKVANSVKIQYTNPSGSVCTYRDNNEDVNFITKVYDIGSKYETTSENQILQGSFLDETFYAGYGDDTINTVGGTNTIILRNGGRDVITLGEGADYIDGDFVNPNDYYQDYAELGTNTVATGITIKNGTSADTLKLNNHDYSGDDYQFFRDINDLVIIENYQYSGQSRLSRFTIEDYFTAESKIVIRKADSSEYVFTLNNDETAFTAYKTYPHEAKDYTIGKIVMQRENNATVTGTEDSETIIATDLATVTTGDGNDIIYTSATNDTIIVNGTGNKTIIIDENSGKDTIDIQNHLGNVYINFPNASGYKFFKDKNAENKDLIIERFREERINDVYTKVFTERTIIKNYFNLTAEQKANIYIKNLTGESNAEYINFPIDKINYSVYDLYIEGTEANDTIGTTQYNDVIIPDKGNDVINIDNTGNKTIRFAKGDGADIVNLGKTALSGADDQLRISFNDGVTGNSYQINGEDLTLYGTRVNGDEIITDSVTIKGIKSKTGTPVEVTAENIANYNGGLNVSNKIRFYKNYLEWSGWYNRYYERENQTALFATNTPYLIQGSTTETNEINATNISNLVTGGSSNDTITASGQINHVYTGAGDDTIDVTSSLSSVIYAGSGKDTITVNGDATAEIYAYDGDDVINVTSGRANINMGKGADTVNITGGTGGTIDFVAGEGDKTINFNGASNAEYAFNFTGYEIIYDNEFYKQNDDFIIKAKHRYKEPVDTITINNFFNSSDAKLNNNNFTNLDITGHYSSTYSWSLNSIDLNVLGTDNGDGTTTFEGSVCEDIIDGTDGVDLITLKTNYDKVTAGKGDDLITITGAGGDKHFYYSKGDGNDTITIGDGVVFGSYNYIYLQDKDYSNRPERTSYSIDGNDLVVYRTYKDDNNTVTDSTRIKGIRSATETPVEVTAENIANSNGGLNISGRIYASDYSLTNLAQMTKCNENANNTLSTAADTKNTVIGGTKADTITSNGSDDYISAGAGNDIITTSAATATIYGGEGNDEITATSATATATLYGGEGNDTITSTAATATIYDDAGDDTVIITGGTNNICIGEGSDTIKIKGGQGTINLAAGSGDNTIIFESNNADGTCHLDGDYNIAISGSGWSSTYTKSGEDLIVYRYSNATTDTVTIKGLFGDNQLANGNNLKINGWNLSSMHIEGNYDKKLKATVYSGSNYNDNIYGTDGNDIITTGGGNDSIYLDKGNDKVIIDGSGDKNIYYKQGGNKEIQLGAGVDLGEIYLNSSDTTHTSSYKIVDNDFIWYRTYIDGDKFTTESTRFTGITGGDVTYDNIMGNGDTQLNLTNKLKSRPYLQLTQGNFKKTNKITTEAGTNNLVLGGKKKDKIVLNGLEDVVYASAGADKITVNGEFGSDTVYAGSGNDTIILNAKDKGVDIYGGKGNDKIYANGNSRYNIYGEKGDGNDTLILGKDFNQRLYFYNSGNSPTQQAHSIVNNNLLLYRIYVDGDTITTNSVKVTGIKSRTDTPVEVNYNNIVNSSGGLNISGSYISDYNKNMIQGSASKTNKLSTQKGTYNVVLGGKKKDTVTLNGSYDNAYTGAGADSITIKAGNTHVYAGSGNDTINVKGGSSHQIYTGKGNDTVNITGASGTINLIAGEGNDTFRFTGSEHGNYNLNISGYNNYYNSYYKSGNDLLVKNTYTNAKKKTVTETHTIKDYFNNDSLENKVRINNSYISDRLNSNRLNIVGKYNKSKKATLFDGTKYDDMITGTKEKDIITTGAGYDQITPGKGNDTITINNSGTKNIHINNGDGNDIIRWTNSEEAAPIVIYLNDCDVISYKKSGTNLVITRTYESGNSLKSENTTIEGYYDAEGNVVESVANNLYLSNAGGIIDPEKSFNRVNYKTPNINVSNDYELAVATAKADTITTTAENAAIFALAGNDTININGGNAFVTGGKGTDTINVNTTGLATICHLSGDGNDIVNFGENTPSGLKVNVDSSLFRSSRNTNIDNYMYMSGKHGLIRSGNDLIYSIPTSSAFKTKAEKITFKDYFKDGVNKPAYISLNLSDYDYHLDSLESIASGNGIWVEGINNDGVTTYTGMDNYTNRYEYKGTGKTIINGGNRADYYNVSLNSKSNLYINDSGNQSGWGYDTLYINTNYKNLRALFNMSASGQIIVSEDDQYSDNFMIFNKGSLTYDNVKKIFSGKDGKGVINIDHVFSETTSYSTNGTGSIEYIYAGKDLQKQTYNSGLENNKNVQRLYTSLWVEDLGQEVASWLSANTDGSKTSFEIFETGTKDEINALLKVYNTVYDKNFST